MTADGKNGEHSPQPPDGGVGTRPHPLDRRDFVAGDVDAEALVKHADPRVRRSAEKALAAHDEMLTQLRQFNETTQLHDVEARLVAELAKVRRQLRHEGRRTKHDHNGGQRREAARKIRAWAAANGVPLSAMGRIPKSVREQYEQAARS